MKRLIMVALYGSFLMSCVIAMDVNPSFTTDAVSNYKAKADAGDAEAQYLYSLALMEGLGVGKNEKQAFQL